MFYEFKILSLNQLFSETMGDITKTIVKVAGGFIAYHLAQKVSDRNYSRTKNNS